VVAEEVGEVVALADFEADLADFAEAFGGRSITECRVARDECRGKKQYRVARTEKRNSKFDHEAHEVHEEKKLTTRRQKFSIRNIRTFVSFAIFVVRKPMIGKQ
jgi:hypothetical protein